MCRPKPDFHKCFDQICRPLPYVLLYLTGFPQRVLTAYVAFMEKLQFHNAVAGALGRSHRRDAGIPQGCPLSMMYDVYRILDAALGAEYAHAWSHAQSAS